MCPTAMYLLSTPNNYSVLFAQANNQAAVIGELQHSLRAKNAAEIISPEAIENGTLEEILHKVRSDPLRTNVNGAARGRHRQSINESLRDHPSDL